MARRRTAEVEESEILVKVGRSGGRVEEFAITGEDLTVADALEAAGISVTKGDRIRVNSEIADKSDDISDGDIITVSGKVSGGLV